MPYANPERFIQEYGLDETAQQLADEQQLLTSQLLLDAISVAGGGAWTGTPSAAEQAAATAAYDRLARKLTSVSNFMDGYLRSAVTLPLAANDANAGTLEVCCVGLARSGLADDSDNATERMESIAKEWRSWLKDIAAGRVQLIGAAGEAAPSSGGVKTGQAKSAFDWDRFGRAR